MTTARRPVATVVNCAAASDGGSLWLQLSIDGQIKDYGLDRSLASRGTARYGSVSGERGPLSKEEISELVLMLDVPQQGMCAGLVEEFVRFLKTSGLS